MGTETLEKILFWTTATTAITLAAACGGEEAVPTAIPTSSPTRPALQQVASPTPSPQPSPSPTTTPTPTYTPVPPSPTPTPTYTPIPPPPDTPTPLPSQPPTATPIPRITLNATGNAGETWQQNFYDVTAAYFDGITARVVQTANGPLLDVPWQKTSNKSSVDNFKDFGPVTEKMRSIDRHVIVSDELSELGLLISGANNAERMEALYNTIVAMRGEYGVLPGWVSEWNNGKITNISRDPASDASVRFALALYNASANSNFSAENQKKYRELATQIMQDHMKYEYAQVPAWRKNTDRTYTLLLAGGADSAKGGLYSEIWAGYYPDVINALLTAWHVTKDQSFKDRAELVIEQMLISAEWDGTKLSLPKFNNEWAQSGSTLKPIQGSNDYHWKTDQNGKFINPVGDDSDWPRFLGIGSVLRTIKLTGYASNQDTTSARISAMMQNYTNQFISNGNSGVDGCIQFLPDNKPTWCGKGFYELGLSASLVISNNPLLAEQKVREGYTQYDWNGKRFWAHEGRGIYREVRLHKALMSVLGLDALVFQQKTAALTENQRYAMSFAEHWNNVASQYFNPSAEPLVVNAVPGQNYPDIITHERTQPWITGQITPAHRANLARFALGQNYDQRVNGRNYGGIDGRMPLRPQKSLPA